MKVRPFSWAETNDIEYHITATIRDFDPGIYILHNPPEEIKKHIVNI